jgi:hypothetical protein
MWLFTRGYQKNQKTCLWESFEWDMLREFWWTTWVMENDEPMGSTIVETRHINLGIQNYDFQYFCGRTTSYFIHVALARCRWQYAGNYGPVSQRSGPWTGPSWRFAMICPWVIEHNNGNPWKFSDFVLITRLLNCQMVIYYHLPN